MIKKDSIILFQGDSITDAGRNYDDSRLSHACGQGYMYLIASRLGAVYPELDLCFYNRGCSGNRVVDLYARWKEDAINLLPDIISILIGINGINRDISNNEGVSADRYKKVYRLILEETLQELPGVCFCALCPFCFTCRPKKRNVVRV